MTEPYLPPPDPEAPRRADALPRDTVVAGCEIGRVVADSGFSIVYHARDPHNGLRCAIKEYLPVSLALRSDDRRAVALRAPDHAEAFERGLAAFAAEAELLERLNHPSLLHVLRSWRGHGSIYRVMPWLEGETLLAWRRAQAEPPDETALRLMLLGLLGALQTLHDAGQVHGAVSPSHVMVLTDDRPMLMDTGAVGRALVGDQTRALMAMVTPGFAPAGHGKPIGLAEGQAADVRALAAVAHFAICGELPAAGERPQPLAPLLRRMRVPHGQPSYGAALLDTIESALADDPGRRFATVAAFRAALVVKPDAPQIVLPGVAASPPIDPSKPYLAAAASTTRPAARVPAGPVARRADSRRRRTRLWTWFGAAALATFAVGTIVLVVLKEQSASEMRALARQGVTDELPAPAAQPVDAGLPPTAAGPAPAAEQAVTAPPATEAPATIVPLPVPAPVPAPTTVAAPEQDAASPLLLLRPPPAVLAARPEPAALPEPAPPPTAPPRPAKATRAAKVAAAEAPHGPSSPREVCGARTDFALYRCMSTECQQPTWRNHAQCQRLRATDEVD